MGTSSQEPAGATRTGEAALYRALYRVLRLLAALGVLTEPEPGSFGLPCGPGVPAGLGPRRGWRVLHHRDRRVSG